MKFEIINPSDKAYLEADDFKTACIASAMVCDAHGLSQVDGKLSMPPLLFAQGWFLNTFKESITESFEKADKKEIMKVLKSFKLEGKRSSLRDFVGYAHNLAGAIEERIEVKK
jgi:hypothetical protein